MTVPPPWRRALSSSTPIASRRRAGVALASRGRSAGAIGAQRPPLRAAAAHAIRRRSRSGARRPGRRVRRRPRGPRGPPPAARRARRRAVRPVPVRRRPPRAVPSSGAVVNLLQAQRQRRQPASQLMGNVADEVAFALDQLGQGHGRRVERLRPPGRVRAGRNGCGVEPEVARAEPGRAGGDVPQWAGQPARGDRGDPISVPDRQDRERSRPAPPARPPGSAGCASRGAASTRGPHPALLHDRHFLGDGVLRRQPPGPERALAVRRQHHRQPAAGRHRERQLIRSTLSNERGPSSVPRPARAGRAGRPW